MAKKQKFAPFAMQLCLLLSTLLVLTSCPASPPLAPTDGFNPYLAPEEPTGLQATNGYADSISLSWEKVEGATAYQIWATSTEQYGTATKSISTDDTYSKLLARGFELVDVVTEPNCKLRELDANTAYIFSVVAMKSMKNTQGTSVLYSEPSNFVEGATFGEITLSAVANSKTITLYWDISNLYSILNDSREKQPLYTYNISVYKKLSSSGDWGEGKNLTWEEAQGQTFSFSASALEIDTAYDFKLHLEVWDEDNNVINTIESDAITITSDSSPTPNSVENISATNGLTRHEVTLTWTAPALSEREDIKSVFRLERAETGSTEWTEITTTVTQNADGTYSATDTTLEDNKIYTYRILNGYQIGTKTPVYQAETDAATLQDVYALWMPQDITFIFTIGSDNKSGELEVTYKYNPPATNPAGEIKCYLEGSTWTEKDLSAHTALEKQEITSTTPTYKVSIKDLRPLTYYTFNFTFTRDGQELVNAKAPTDYTLGETGAADLIENFSASNAWVKAICLTWDETDLITSSTDTFKYEIYQDNVKLENVEIEGTGSAKSAYITCEDGEAHNYRIKVASEDGNTFEVDETSGSTLAVPSGLTATDGTSIDCITITWPELDNDKLVYKLNYSYDGTTWTELPASSEGLATLSSKADGTDGSLVSFKLTVSNSDQVASGLAGETSTELESPVETGSVLGPALLNVRIENDGLDPDKITIKWDKVAGADHYRIMRGNTLLPWSKNADTYEDKVENLQALSGESPLNASYTYTVIPCLSDGTQAKITDQSTMAKATGKLFAPPKDVNASKGQEGITLTWSAVENAKKYEIQKYVVSLEDGKFTKQVESGATVTVEGTTYKEIDKSLLSGYVLYKLRSVKEDDTVSQWQEYYNTVTNALGFEEPANIGYKLQNVSDLNVTEVTEIIEGTEIINKAEYYADYATVTWYMVPGATSYTLKSYTGTDTKTDTKTLVGTSTISVDSLTYSETETVNNGVTGKGFLSYDPTVGLYTYNDGNDLFVDSYEITYYEIIANSSSGESEVMSGTTNRYTTIHKQPTAKDWVNIVLNILHPAFKAANSKFNGDWWLTILTSNNYTYPNSGMEFILKGSTSYSNSDNYLKITSYKDTKTKLTLSTESNIQFDITDGGVKLYGGTDPLKTIGYNGNGTIAVTPEDSKLKSFTIKFNNVSVTSTPGGSFTVTITDKSGSTETTVNDSSDLTRVLGD